MSYYRVSFEKYLEDEFESAEDARETFLWDICDRIDADDLTVEVWNEENQVWE